jgi:hypothetical protein
MAIEYLSKGNDDGTSLGNKTTEKVSLYGVTPIVQGTISASAGTDAATLVTEVAEIRAALVALGLFSA